MFKDVLDWVGNMGKKMIRAERLALKGVFAPFETLKRAFSLKVWVDSITHVYRNLSISPLRHSVISFSFLVIPALILVMDS